MSETSPPEDNAETSPAAVPAVPDEGYAFLNEEAVQHMVARAKATGSFSELIRTLGKIFSDYCALKQSFQRERAPRPPIRDGAPKEETRAQTEEDKDIDSSESRRESLGSVDSELDDGIIDLTPDIDALRRSYTILFELEEQDGSKPAVRPVVNTVPSLCRGLEMDFVSSRLNINDPGLINVIVFVMELPMLEIPDLSDVLPSLCNLITKFPMSAQARFSRIMAVLLRDNPARLQQYVYTVQQLITTRLLSGVFRLGYIVNEDSLVCDATRFLRILFAVDILAGDMEPRLVYFVENEEDESDVVPDFVLNNDDDEPRLPPGYSKLDPLFVELGIDTLDCRKPLIELDEFYNELLSDQLLIEHDYSNYREGNPSEKFSFLFCPFILTPSARIQALNLDNRIKMSNHRTRSYLSSLMHGELLNPVLKLRVRREHIVEDALVNLEWVALENPTDLKKQLVVEFDGEQGVDEGGVSKEFFQLIVEQLFNIDYGMFTVDEETQSYWFNQNSFENDAQFSLIGIILGLAIYNNVILDIRFPMVVYRKLFGVRGTYRDLLDYRPTLARGLHQLLMYSEPDICDVFDQTFRVNYIDVFGNYLSHDLKAEGDGIRVDHTNKVEFVELYADYLLNKSVERQFNAFKKGFDMVTKDSKLTKWFSPEELELLVCGQEDFDSKGLQQSCEYDGYSADCEVIKWFWEVVHEMSDEEKKQFLQFTTGSDRVPVGGLAKLRMIITRHGPDSDRLPSSHTCFNVLLLPEYSSREKLKERLLKAISYSKGFGLM
ncbi:ubiquitin-protein ligase E3A [Galendromus occidentalis]|uniref:Ubiquitin-protein ligase E3A n=1 Tax=Galendromus occidentalis TaxID=34638 RepID=A0AAJ6QMF5_9ACAR|nr:ubiquitin-protein ligase E3A [Galendromus occidentalis]